MWKSGAQSQSKVAPCNDRRKGANHNYIDALKHRLPGMSVCEDRKKAYTLACTTTADRCCCAVRTQRQAMDVGQTQSVRSTDFRMNAFNDTANFHLQTEKLRVSNSNNLEWILLSGIVSVYIFVICWTSIQFSIENEIWDRENKPWFSRPKVSSL